jgi:hypothetical protein
MINLEPIITGGLFGLWQRSIWAALFMASLSSILSVRKQS